MSVRVFVCVLVCVSVYLSDCLVVCVCEFVCLSVCPHAWVVVFLSFSLSVLFYVCLSFLLSVNEDTKYVIKREDAWCVRDRAKAFLKFQARKKRRNFVPTLFNSSSKKFNQVLGPMLRNLFVRNLPIFIIS
jgi:hypothetical protein